MKFLLTIPCIILFSPMIFASNDSTMTNTKVCGKFYRAEFETCSFSSVSESGARTDGYEIKTAKLSLEIVSTESYEGVDAAELANGLYRLGREGLNMEMAAFVAGPVVHTMNRAANEPTEENLSVLAKVKLKLARRISKM